MKKKSPLEPFGNAADDLLYWTKQYLAGKIDTLSVDKKFTDAFDRKARRRDVINSDSIEALDTSTKEIRRTGMKNLGIYSISLLAFCRYVKADKKIESIREIDTPYRDAYFTLNPSSLAASSLESHFTQVNSLMKFIEGHNSESYAFGLGRTRGGRRTAKPIPRPEREISYLPPEEFKRFLKTLQTYPFQSECLSQPRLMMKLVCFGGLRTEELVSLETSRLSIVRKSKTAGSLLPGGKYLRIVVAGKASKERVVFIKGALIEEDYLDHLECHKPCENDLLFCNKAGQRYNNRAPYDQAKRLLESANIHRGQYGLHMLRRSYATFLFSQGVDLAVVAELLGHSDEEITELYIQVTKDGLRKVTKYWAVI